jgi:hypothetical protein
MSPLKSKIPTLSGPRLTKLHYWIIHSSFKLQIIRVPERYFLAT